MAKKQAKKSKGAKKERVNEFFTPVSMGALEFIKNQCIVDRPVFSHYQGMHPKFKSPIGLIGMTVTSVHFDRIMQILCDMSHDTTFSLNDMKTIHNNCVYDAYMRGKLKMSASEYIHQLWTNAKLSICGNRFKIVTDAALEQARKNTEIEDQALHISSMVMNIFQRHILNIAYNALGTVLYSILYSGNTNLAEIYDVTKVWNNVETLEECILQNTTFQNILNQVEDGGDFQTIFTGITKDMLTLVAKKWLETAVSDEEYNDIIDKNGLSAINWKRVDLLKILPELLATMKEFNRCRSKHYKYSGLCPEMEITRPMTENTNYNDVLHLPVFELPSKVLTDRDEVRIDERLFKASWDTMIQKTLANKKSDMSIRFVSDKYKKSSINDEPLASISKVVRDWSIPGIIKAVFPNKLHTTMLDAMILADHFEFEVIYRGNPDRLNYYAFDSDDKLIPDLTPESYECIYDYIMGEGNVLVLNHREKTIFLDEKLTMTNVISIYEHDSVTYTTFELRKIIQCIIDAYNYLKSKEIDGSIDFYFEENEIVTHQSTKRRKIIHRRGSFVRGHYRHYKSGVVTLVRPHVRKGTNYVGEYILEI